MVKCGMVSRTDEDVRFLKLLAGKQFIPEVYVSVTEGNISCSELATQHLGDKQVARSTIFTVTVSSIGHRLTYLFLFKDHSSPIRAYPIKYRTLSVAKESVQQSLNI